MVQLSGCRLVRAVPHPKAVKKQAEETLYDAVIGALTAFQPKKRLAWHSKQITGGKRTCQCTLRRLRIARCEFGPSSCSRLDKCLSWMLGRDDQTIASRKRARQADRGRGRLWTEVVTSAPNGASWRAACLVTLGFRLTMSRWRIFSAAIATRRRGSFALTR
jgi:hypothetical protein